MNMTLVGLDIQEFVLIPNYRKEYSKSDRHIWEAAAQAEEKRREQARSEKKAEQWAIADEIRKQRQDMVYSVDDPKQRAAEAIPPADPPKPKGVGDQLPPQCAKVLTQYSSFGLHSWQRWTCKGQM